MTAWTDRIREVYVAALGEPVGVDVTSQPVAVDVAADHWLDAVTVARDVLGCTFFDWLSAVDESGEGFRVVCHLAAHRPGEVDHLVVRTLLPREDPAVASVASVFAGARWHERETREMFGIGFTERGERLELRPLLLPEEFEGHPLRKDFVLVARVAKAWPGAKEPGESAATPVRSRRRARPPGVPAPHTWGDRP